MARARRELPAQAPLYKTDFYSWALEQGALLRQGRFAELDAENMIDEVEALARGEAGELDSHYVTLLLHLLKWQFQPEQRSNSWSAAVRRSRIRIAKLLDQSPGLKPRRQELFESAYPEAREGAAGETNLPLDHFPAENPYALEQAIDLEFWPGGREMPARDMRKRLAASSRERTWSSTMFAVPR
jgi:hypothetical protein